ncbi:Ig-like domain-containing protein [Noviherbaspirillum pedocola]|uniref:Ig-like domain-containing protein n=1 Tax=Noviherbaspirillum pedocola TaxID=2801341 RepID=A0A934STR3_9BURK|nr:Ig-like domain-containing protein [Noviherbaspirillum pedocola]MBK4735517.1 Ig-like domain-containing protein [Noviherbaspirillum pedocola]
MLNSVNLVAKISLGIINGLYKTDPGVGDACVKKFANDTLNGTEFTKLLTDPNADNLYSYIKKIIGMDNPVTFIKTLTDYAKGCPDPGLEVAKTTSGTKVPDTPFAKFISTAYARLALSKSIYAAGDLSLQLYKYYNYKQSVDVCKKEGVVVPCEFTLRVTPAGQTITIADLLQMNATLTDKTGRDFGAPANMKWSSDTPGVAWVDANTGLVTGVSPGETIITGTDLLTFAKGTAIVKVTVNNIDEGVKTELQDYALTPCTTNRYEAGTRTGGINYQYDLTACSLGKKVYFTCVGGCFDSNNRPRYSITPRNATATLKRPCEPDRVDPVSTAREPVHYEYDTGRIWYYGVIVGVTKVVGSLDPYNCSISYDVQETFDIILPSGKATTSVVTYFVSAP